MSVAERLRVRLCVSGVKDLLGIVDRRDRYPHDDAARSGTLEPRAEYAGRVVVVAHRTDTGSLEPRDRDVGLEPG